MSNTQDLSPQGYNLNEEPYNINPFWEQEGKGGGGVSVQVGSVTTQTTAPGTQASVGIQNVGTEQDAVLNFNFSIPRGNTGDKGDRGTAGTNGSDGVGVASVEQTVTSSVDGGDNVITITLTNGRSYNFIVKNGSQGSRGQQGETGPRGLRGETGGDGRGIQSIAQTTTSTADDGNNIITCVLTDGSTQTFTIKNGSKGSQGERGEKGETGNTGPQGLPGADGHDGLTPLITATATVDDQTGTPSVDVTKTGTDEAPSFEFAFHNLKGEKGESGGGGGGSSSSYYAVKDTLNSSFTTSDSYMDLTYSNYTPVSGDYARVTILDEDTQDEVDSIIIPILGGEYSGILAYTEGTHNIVKDISGSFNFVTVTYEPNPYYLHMKFNFVGSGWQSYSGNGYSITCNLIGKE